MSLEEYQQRAKSRSRLRDLGVAIGRLPTGPHNAITDVPGVRVGQVTLIEGSGQHSVRTGVTVILPNDDVYGKKLVSNGFVLSGAGEVSGFTQLCEWGLLETPIALTNTLAVGRVSESIIQWMANRYPEIGCQQQTVIPVVGECDDSFLNNSVSLPLQNKDVFAALESARGGAVEEGAVGAGTGMICSDFKAGIGTSSRVIHLDGQNYTLGVLVCANFGIMEDLRVDGYPIGRWLLPVQGQYARRTENYGSIIVVIATDLPLGAQQLQRVCRRGALGIGRVGSYGAHGSGEILVGFTTANPVKHHGKELFNEARVLRDSALDPVFKGVIEATEEAILNSLCKAVDMEGAGTHRVPAIDLALLQKLLAHCQSAEKLVPGAR